MSAITQKRVIKAEERIPQIPEKLFCSAAVLAAWNTRN